MLEHERPATTSESGVDQIARGNDVTPIGRDDDDARFLGAAEVREAPAECTPERLTVQAREGERGIAGIVGQPALAGDHGVDEARDDLGQVLGWGVLVPPDEGEALSDAEREIVDELDGDLLMVSALGRLPFERCGFDHGLRDRFRILQPLVGIVVHC